MVRKMKKRSRVIFVIYDCKKRNPIHVTGSAREARDMLEKGIRIDVFEDKEFKEKIYVKNKKNILPYVSKEKEFIRRKQRDAEIRNRRG